MLLFALLSLLPFWKKFVILLCFFAMNLILITLFVFELLLISPFSIFIFCEFKLEKLGDWNEFWEKWKALSMLWEFLSKSCNKLLESSFNSYLKENESSNFFSYTSVNLFWQLSRIRFFSPSWSDSSELSRLKLWLPSSN